MTTRPLLLAMLSAAAITAEFVGGKATRDALFLTSLHATALPAMLIGTALCSIALVALYSRVGGRLSPAVLVPGSFITSGILFVLEWFFRADAPAATAVVLYLHVSGAGPLLASGFWLIASERFDPSTAKARFGQIAGAGTFGGLLGAVMAERVASLLGAPPMLLFLAVLQFLAAGLVWMLAQNPDARHRPTTPANLPNGLDARIGAGGGRTALRTIAEAPHLRHLMALVLLGTTSAALLEYLFKSRAVDALGPGDGLLRFFALFYGVTSLISFVLQVAGSTAALKRFGLALTTSSPSIALLAGSVVGLIAPGFGSLVVARAGESIFRASWFRAGYELFFTPLAAAEKRAAKPFIDVALDRIGDAVGGGIIRLVVVFIPLSQSNVILTIAMLCSIGAIVAASHLNRWYLRTLETSLVNQGGDVDLSEPKDGATARVLASFRSRRARAAERNTTDATTTAGGFVLKTMSPVSATTRIEVQNIMALRMGSRDQVIEVLSKVDGLTAGLVPHVIALLAWEPVADHAMFALRKVAEERVGELLDALLNPGTDYAIRRRLARVFSVCVSQRAADGLLLALDDERFEVRFQAARSLVAILEKNPRIRIDRTRVEDVVLHEVAVSRPIWNGRRLLARSAGESPLDAFVKDRAGQSLAHVFTLLSLVLPREPLQIAFRSLNSEDKRLRGTAIEYLDEVLPAAIRQGLWPFLVPQPAIVGGRPDSEVMSDVLRASSSVTLANLARQQGRDGASRQAAGLVLG